MTSYFEREFAPKILEALDQMPVVVITGLRQAGKTTFLQRQPGLEKRRYVTFDDFGQLSAAKAAPDLFVTSEDPLTIDEAHKCPEILTAIKRVVDKKRIPGQFLLSGSANFLLLKSIGESLAGRSVYFEMHPFSRREINNVTAKEAFLKRFFNTLQVPKNKHSIPLRSEDILNGGMPTVCLGEIKNRSLWFKGYEQTYLERDLREISRIEDMMTFRNLLHLAALRTGQLLSPSQLGRDSKLPIATTSRYLSLLETSFIVRRLSPYLRNKASRLIKSPKLYITDSGLASYLAGIEEIDIASTDPFMGAMFETYVMQNLLNIVQGKWTEAHLYFWNIQGRHEVDFVIEVGRECIAIEVKSGSRWQEKDLSGLRAFLSKTSNCRAGILGYNGTDAIRVGEMLWVFPVSLILS